MDCTDYTYCLAYSRDCSDSDKVDNCLGEYTYGFGLKRLNIENDFCDITIIVGTRRFRLHRIILAVKSNYFEKLFTCKLSESEREEFEFNLTTEELFRDIVDYIYEDDLEGVLNKRNFVSFFMAMDYLQVDVNLNSYEKFIKSNASDLSMEQMLELYNFLTLHQQYQSLTLIVGQYLSKNLAKLQEKEYFLHSSVQVFKEILTIEQCNDRREEKRDIAKICAKWICQNLESRLRFMVELVNAVKYRYEECIEICDRVPEIGEISNQDLKIQLQNVEQYFQRLSRYHGEISAIPSKLMKKPDDEEISVASKVNKLKTMLDNCYFHDVVVNGKNESFHLHRIILCKMSPYFLEIFKNVNEDEITQMRVHSEEDDALKNSNKRGIAEVRLPSEVDDNIFNAIVLHMYGEKVNFSSRKYNFVGLFKACKIFKVKEFERHCEAYVMGHPGNIKDVFELFKYFNESDREDLRRILEQHITEIWPEVYNMENLFEISFDEFRELLTIPDLTLRTENYIVKICAKWIARDVPNRYRYIFDIVGEIIHSRNLVIKHETYKNENDGVCLSQSAIEQKLNDILNSHELIPYSATQLPLSHMPLFMESLESGNPRFRILDADLRVVDNFSSSYPFNTNTREGMSERIPHEISKTAATLINENLYITFKMKNKRNFNVYNLASQKCISLTPLNVSSKYYFENVALLNCNDSIYYCGTRDGDIFKYSPTLNRWLTTISSEPVTSWYASDEKLLYKFFLGSNGFYSAQLYDERDGVWKSLPDARNVCDRYDIPVCSAIVDGKLSVLFGRYAIALDLGSGAWRRIAHISDVTPSHHMPEIFRFVGMKQHGNQVVYITGDDTVCWNLISVNSWRIISSNNREGRYSFRRRDLTAVHYI